MNQLRKSLGHAKRKKERKDKKSSRKQAQD